MANNRKKKKRGGVKTSGGKPKRHPRWLLEAEDHDGTPIRLMVPYCA